MMRWIFLLGGLTAAALQVGCDRTPQSFGITGPAPQAAPQMMPDDTVLRPPGLPNSGTGSGEEQRFYNYN